MKVSTLIIYAIFILLAFSYFTLEGFSYSPEKKFEVVSYIPSEVSVPEKESNHHIPRRIIRCFATNKFEEIFRKSIESTIDLNPEYEHVFMTDKDCDEFMNTYFSGRVENAYKKIIPGAYKSDIFRLCYLYQFGGIYLDINKTLLVPFDKILDKDYDFVSTIDITDCAVWQGFLAAKPQLEFFQKCIDHCVRNVENNFYGKNDLDVTGPVAIGKVYRQYYGKCPEQGIYFLRGNLIKLGKLKGTITKAVYYDNLKFLDINSLQRRKMNRFWKFGSKPHYSELWKKKQIYPKK